MSPITETVLSGEEFSSRVLELRKKIHSSEYVDFAIQRIAQVLSLKLVEDRNAPFAKRSN